MLVGRPAFDRESEELAGRVADGAPPCDGPLAVDSLDVADLGQAEVDSRRDEGSELIRASRRLSA